MAPHTVEAVEGFRGLLEEMLKQAHLTKPTNEIEPALTKADFGNLEERIASVPGLIKPSSTKKTAQYAIVETAVRDVLNGLLATESIDLSGFMQVWNLLDIVSFFSDEEQCDPALLFWLIEEILDSQTIAGCRIVFDYLESRRERITAKHFAQKNLVILRTCNELLKRLSRAEDTAFCGRVFIFMFQSFPLGDKSSVNLRGEYHVENVTAFDPIPPKGETDDKMDVDEPKNPPTGPAADLKAVSPGAPKLHGDSKLPAKSVTFDAKKSSPAEKPLDADELYPVFWSLQRNFSQPKTLFDSVHFTAFKRGLEATLVTFEVIQSEQQARGSSKSTDDGRRGIKRKRGQNDGDLANTFNPKYLTSRDLFELEISDLSFRRHIAVQALIILDFLLSLSLKAKEKLATVTTQNKSVMYQDQILNEEDTQWALETKKRIADYLKQGAEGPFFYRMVETVLSRDKNWVRWKIENCPSILRPAISSAEYLSAKASAKRAATSKRLRPHPQMSLDLKFLVDAEGAGGMEKLKASRFNIPTLDDFRRKIADDDFEIEMPTNDESKERALNGKASKSWRALRIASKTKLALFDKIDDPDKIDIIFTRNDPVEHSLENGQYSTADEDYPMPSDRRPIVITSARKDSIVKELLGEFPKTFGKIVVHTTRAAEGEANGIDYHFVTKEEFGVMRDGDQFLEHVELNGNSYGTNKKALESIVASGKVPILVINYERAQQLKEQGFSARYVFVSTSSLDELERELREVDKESKEAIQSQLKLVKDEADRSTRDGIYDKVIVKEDSTALYEALENYIFGKEKSNQTGSSKQDDEAMPRTLEENGTGENATASDYSAAKDIPMTDTVDIPIAESEST